MENNLIALDDGLSLYAQIEQKEKELELLKNDFQAFKAEFIRQMEAQEVESIK